MGGPVVAGASEAVTLPPHGYKGSEVGNREPHEPGVATTGDSSPISEGHFMHSITRCQCPNQNFLEDIEVGRRQLEFPEDCTAIQAVTPRENGDPQRQTPTQTDVQDPAPHPPR